MPVTEQIKAAVERVQDGEKIGVSTHFSQPVVRLLDVNVITQNVEFARKTESEINDVIAKRDKAVAKVRSDKTRHPEIVKQEEKDIVARATADLDTLLAKLDENAPLLRGQQEHYSPEKCLARTPFAGGDAARTATMMRLQRLSSAGLIEAARGAVASADAATLGCLQDEANARQDLPNSDPRGISREVRAELNALIAQAPSDAAKVSALLADYDLRLRRAKIAAGRGNSRDRIAAGLMARQQGASK
jgi:hypothetical protein